MSKRWEIKMLKKDRLAILDEYEKWGDIFYTRKWLIDKLTLIDAAIKKLEPNWCTIFTIE